MSDAPLTRLQATLARQQTVTRAARRDLARVLDESHTAVVDRPEQALELVRQAIPPGGRAAVLVIPVPVNHSHQAQETHP